MQLLGTPHYTLQEVAAGTLKLSTTSGDIYALGVILYELLAGRLPFEAENLPALLRKIADEEPDSLTDRSAPSRDPDKSVPSRPVSGEPPPATWLLSALNVWRNPPPAASHAGRSSDDHFISVTS